MRLDDITKAVRTFDADVVLDRSYFQFSNKGIKTNWILCNYDAQGKVLVEVCGIKHSQQQAMLREGLVTKQPILRCDVGSVYAFPSRPDTLDLFAAGDNPAFSGVVQAATKRKLDEVAELYNMRLTFKQAIKTFETTRLDGAKLQHRFIDSVYRLQDLTLDEWCNVLLRHALRNGVISLELSPECGGVINHALVLEGLITVRHSRNGR
ncbi:MAG: hypothetical protein SAqTSB_38760 [Shewanella algae]